MSSRAALTIASWCGLGLLAPIVRCQRSQPLPADPAACGRCHAKVHEEWQDSAHARSFTDPLFQQALAARNRPDRCLPCHVPNGVLERLGQMPRARADRREDGIRCIDCHGRDGVVHGPDGTATEAHPTLADPAFSMRGSVGLCASCHDMRIADVLPLARDFRAARLRDDGESCIGCHMERVLRPPARDPDAAAGGGAARGEPNEEEPNHQEPNRRGRSHRLLGPADPAFCASAFLLAVATGPSGAELRIQNGAGHGVPGLARLRTFPVRLSLQDQSGRILHELQFAFSWQDRLLVEEERRIPLPEVAGAVVLRVRVDHTFAGGKPVAILDRTLELP